MPRNIRPLLATSAVICALLLSVSACSSDAVPAPAAGQASTPPGVEESSAPEDETTASEDAVAAAPVGEPDTCEGLTPLVELAYRLIPDAQLDGGSSQGAGGSRYGGVCDFISLERQALVSMSFSSMDGTCAAGPGPGGYTDNPNLSSKVYEGCSEADGAYYFLRLQVADIDGDFLSDVNESDLRPVADSLLSDLTIFPALSQHLADQQG
ncbi:hypothetical protein E3T26_12900 [Cryobacterium sp. TMT1-21]|uniref:hypothetical protein n=1 Tax=unclassified Cryobacterium TaxID=2649013 RepID=UPI00106A3175|nr:MULTISPECIES: hypothetical protein [unclassified Cryobacterium]TFD11316.1 hypothetical protein E3T26_12900 [Cryobacterium sp. TMT1-21]TFD17873.1 hypothetical protein E3T42_07005 [Cryobacterium sp. TMT4-10]